MTLKIYDLIGREIETIINENRTAGIHEVVVNSSSLASGMYFYSIEFGNSRITKQMMLIK